MRLIVRLCMVVILLCMITADVSAGPFARMRARRAQTSSGCGSASSTQSSTHLTACVQTIPQTSLPVGTQFTDSNGNTWTIVAPLVKK